MIKYYKEENVSEAVRCAEAYARYAGQPIGTAAKIISDLQYQVWNRKPKTVLADIDTGELFEIQKG